MIANRSISAATVIPELPHTDIGEAIAWLCDAFGFSLRVSCGARVLREPATHPCGERQYSVEDPGGYVWTFSQSVADVVPKTGAARLTRFAPAPESPADAWPAP